MGITVLKINYEVRDPQYVGVTPGRTHTLAINTVKGIEGDRYEVEVYCKDHSARWFHIAWLDSPNLGKPNAAVHISWSPQINKHAPDSKDYK